MKRLLPLFILLLLIAAALYYLLPRFGKKPLPFPSPPNSEAAANRLKAALHMRAMDVKEYVQQKKLSSKYCFLIDMSQPSGRKRFYVYDMENDSLLFAGLVSHGSCNKKFLQKASFSNTPNSGCSSLGKYKVGYAYKGRFGKAYKLFGLEGTNSKAFDRAVVLHAYDCVPDSEVYPYPICNSLGCPMVSNSFLSKLSRLIDSSRKPVLLWIYE